MAVIIAVISLFTAQMVHAQSKWSIEIRPSVNFPVRKLAGADLNTGFGIEGTVLYRFMPHTSAYAGWGWNLFPQQASEENDISNEETGYKFGVQFLHPIAGSIMKYYVKGGGIYTHLELEEGDHMSGDSGHKLGWELESGVSFPIGSRLSINPGLRYHDISGKITRNGAVSDFRLNYVSVSVGVVTGFR